MKSETMWVLVADAGRVRIFERASRQAEFVERTDLASSKALPRSSDLMSDRLARSHDSAGPGRHAIEPSSDPHRELKRETAAEISTELRRQAQSGAFDTLVVAAPPPFLGDLRAAFPHQVSDRVVGEFPKDLTKVPGHDLAKRLGEMIEAAGLA